MWELDCKERWTLKNWCFWTVVLEKTLESLLGCKEIQPVNPKGNQSWICIGRADAEAPILRSPDVKNWLIGNDPDAGTDWGREEKGMTEDGMVGWHHQLGHEFEQALGVGDGPGNLACCISWSCKVLDMTQRLNWTEAACAVCKFWRLIPCQSHHLQMSLFNCPVMSHSLRCYGLQLDRSTCPLPSPGVCPGSCSFHWWCHPALSSSNALFSFCR